jgi:hypothetical protein
MNLLADENVEMAMVDWLRSAGHDVAWAVESFPTELDSALLRCRQAVCNSRTCAIS